jgi:hypothetical protein
LVEKFYLQQYSEGIFIWSDNGFKNKMRGILLPQSSTKTSDSDSMSLFCNLSWVLNLCDRHFGTAKKKLRSINRTTLVRSIEQVDAAFALISNTSTYLIDIDQE